MSGLNPETLGISFCGLGPRLVLIAYGSCFLFIYLYFHDGCWPIRMRSKSPRLLGIIKLITKRYKFRMSTA